MSDKNIEIWRPVKGYEGLYEVSNLGRIKSLYNRTEINKVLKPAKVSSGYLAVSLCKDKVRKTQRVHRLVAEAFIPNPDNKPCVDHINTDRTDNRIENLRWTTQKENCNNPNTINNISNKMRNNWETPTIREKYVNNKSVPVVQMSKEQSVITIFKSLAEAQKITGIRIGNIWGCCNGKRKTAGGYKWQYIN